MEMSFNEVVEKLGVTRTSVYNFISKGLLTPKKTFNNRVFFSKEEVDKLIESKTAVK